MAQSKKAKQTQNRLQLLLHNKYVLFGLIPLLVYGLFFTIYTWPWVTHFNGWFMTDAGDGLQNVWNVWWIQKSVTEFHQLPWHTTFLHHPFGVTLVGQTLNPFNGFVALPLLSFLSLNQAFNVMVIFSFLFGGLTAFWLCYYFTKAYWPSIVGGAIYTFSSYHFAHAIGHMQLVSLEFVPLFILLWWKFVRKPSYRLASAASVSLLLVLLCDYYYFLYSVMLAIFIFCYLWWRKEVPDLRERTTYLPFGLFIALCVVLVLPLPVALLVANSRDSFAGSHPARIYSTDIVTAVLNGGFWKFHELTNWYWRRIPGYVAESSVYLSVSVITLLIVALWRRTKVHRDVMFWMAVGIFFGVMSLGPRLMLSGRTRESVPLPYILMERVIPGMKLSGMPVRMMFMVTLASAVIAAMVLAKLRLSTKVGKALFLAFCLLLFLELWPSRLPITPNTQPAYVFALRKLPSTGGVLDNAASTEPWQLYHQTGFDKPMILGYISRTPESLIQKEKPLYEHLSQEKYDLLCSEYKLRYVTTPATRPLKTSFPAVYSDGTTIIYDIKNSPNC